MKNFSQGPKWIPGVLQESSGPISFEVVLEDGRTVHEKTPIARSSDTEKQ